MAIHRYKKAFIIILFLILCSSTVYFYRMYIDYKNTSSYLLRATISNLVQTSYQITEKIDVTRQNYRVSEIKELLALQSKLVTDYAHVYFSLGSDDYSNTATIPHRLAFHKRLEHLITGANDLERITLDKQELAMIRSIYDLSLSIRTSNEGLIMNKQEIGIRDVENLLERIYEDNAALLLSPHDNRQHADTASQLRY